MRAGILGLGQWLPEKVRTNDYWPKEFVEAHGKRAQAEFTEVQVNPDGDAIDQLVAKYASSEKDDPFLGAIERRVASDDMRTHIVELAAAEDALKNAGLDGSCIDLVISYSTIPDRVSPPPATLIAHAVGAHNAVGFGIAAACASSIIGLDIATAFIESGQANFVLLTQSHLMTRAFPVMHPASPNIGDAATAIVVGKVNNGGILALKKITHGEYYDAVMVARRKDDAIMCHPGGHISVGSYNSEQAAYLVYNTVRFGATTINEALAQTTIKPADIDVVASVQPRQWVPKAIAESAGINSGLAVETFKTYAHLGACGPIVNLIEARKRNMLKAGSKVALYGQGAGFTRAAAVIDWSY